MIKTQNLRIRKSSFELFQDCLFRVQSLLIGKNTEFHQLDKPLKQDLAMLASSLRKVTTTIVEQHLLFDQPTKRSKELSKTLDLIDSLVEKDVLHIVK